MSWDTTEDDIKEYFEHFGEIVRVQLRRRQCSGKSKGFGFIQFADKEVENKASFLIFVFFPLHLFAVVVEMVLRKIKVAKYLLMELPRR